MQIVDAITWMEDYILSSFNIKNSVVYILLTQKTLKEGLEKEGRFLDDGNSPQGFLDSKSDNCHHCKSAMLQLLRLHLQLSSLVFWEESK